MRSVSCLILALCFALAADAGPLRRASGCAGGSCNVTPVAHSATELAKPFSPRDLVMAPTTPKTERVVLPAEPVAMQLQSCSGGQCSTTPANRFGRVTVRVFRR